MALDVVVPHLRNEVCECIHCCRLLTKEGHDFVLLLLRPPDQLGHLVECVLELFGPVSQ